MSGVGGVSQSAPRVSTQHASQGIESARPATSAAETASAETAPTESAPPAGATRDVYERGGATSPRALALSSSEAPSSAPAGDPALASDLRGELARQHANGPRLVGRHAEAPRVTDGEQVPETGATGDVARRQQAFVEEMRGRGVEASQPPTESQLRDYFRTFNNREDRPEALRAYERYASAYHVHPENAGRPGGDVRYSANERYMLRGRYYESREDMERAASRMRGDVEYTSVDPRTPDSWDEVSSARSTHEGRSVNDCEGYAFMGQELLREAGYRTTAVAADGPGDVNHAMVIARDPQRAREAHVVSNHHVHSGRAGSAGERALLDEAFTAAGGELPATYYRGATQDEAQTRMAVAGEQ